MPAFDLVVCRHMSQAVPDFPQVLAEITRVLRARRLAAPAVRGLRHVAYSRATAVGFDPDRFWNEHVIAFLASIGCDGRVGRHSPPLLQPAGYDDIAMDYVIVDTLRVPRDTFAGIIEAWRDGYTTRWPRSAGVPSRRGEAPTSTA